MRPRPRVRRGLALAWQALGRALPRAGVWGYEAAPPVMGYPSVAPRAPQLLAPLPTSGPGDLAATPADSSPGALNAAPLGSADVRVLNLPKLQDFVRRHEQPTDTPYGPTLSTLLMALVSRSVMLEVSRAGALLAGPGHKEWRPSRMCRAVQDALDNELMATPPRGRGPFGSASVFPVWKSDLVHARLITWPEELNRHMPPPYSGLEPHRALRDLWMRSAWGVTLDMRGAFNQFPLSESVRRLFTCRVGRQGRAQLLCPSRLPMGWVGSPALCQRVLRLLLREAGLESWSKVHIDNVFIGGSSAEDVRARVDAFLQLCTSFDITMLVEGGVEAIGTQVTFLGLHVDLTTKTAAFKPAFVQKVTAMQLVTVMPYQSFRVCVGLALWTAIMSNTQLFHLHNLLWTLSDAARERAVVLSPQLPSGDVKVTGAALGELEAMQQKVLETFNLLAPSPPVTAVHLTTDACHSGGAAVWTWGPGTKILQCDHWPWHSGHSDDHINVLEMWACDMALESDFPVGATAVTLPWDTDSMVCLQAVQKGFSGSRQLGVPLSSLLSRCEGRGLVLAPTHVVSECNIADRPSRLYSGAHSPVVGTGTW